MHERSTCEIEIRKMFFLQIKCNIPYLGHIIVKKKIKQDLSKVQAI